MSKQWQMLIKVWKLFKMRWRIGIKTKKVDGCETEVVILCIHHASGRYDIHMSSAADYISHTILASNDRYN